MREAVRDEELLAALGVQADGDVLPVGRRAGRMSTAMSRMAPASTRMSLACGWGGIWKCRPRIVPWGAEKDWLSCTNEMAMPACSRTSARKVSENQPRASPWRFGTMRFTAGIAVSITSKRYLQFSRCFSAVRETWTVSLPLDTVVNGNVQKISHSKSSPSTSAASLRDFCRRRSSKTAGPGRRAGRGR